MNYQAGVGTSGGVISRIVGGATGMGLEENVRETYSFIAINYHPGDEIFLLGFSRGAWTARSVAGMIGALGLLTRQGLPMFPEIYKDFKHRLDPTYVPRSLDIPFPDKPPFEDPAYVAELERRSLTRLDIPIKAVGVWDTVGIASFLSNFSSFFCMFSDVRRQEVWAFHFPYRASSGDSGLDKWHASTASTTRR